jgi:hypothetical protein
MKPKMIRPQQKMFKPIKINPKNIFIDRGVNLNSKIIEELRRNSNMTIKEFVKQYGMK